MGFSQAAGYIPTTIETIMLSIMDNVNAQFGTTYTEQSFLGTNWYKFFYALVQRLQENEIKTSEIFAQVQQYFNVTNERIQRPVVTNPGVIENLAKNAYIASVKPPAVADAGKAFVCVAVNDGLHAAALVTITSYANLVSGTHDIVTVNGTAFTAQGTDATLGTGTFQAATSNTATASSLATQINAHPTASLTVKARAVGALVYLTAVHGGIAGNALTLAYTDNDTNIGATKSGTVFSGGTDNVNYADTRLAVCNIIKDSIVAGVISQGSESETIVLSNGQSFAFKFNLPSAFALKLRLTTTLSQNNEVAILSPDIQKQALLDNIGAKYGLGKNFEPQRYFSLADAPWASDVLLEYSLDGGSTYLTAVIDTNYDDLYTFQLSDVLLVEN